MTDNDSPAGKNGGSQPKTAVKTATRLDRQQRVISTPEGIAKLVMMQIDSIGADSAHGYGMENENQIKDAA